MERIIKIILLEDNDAEIIAFQDFIETKNNITLISKTKSSDEALNLVKKHTPDVIILDLELHEGTGSGFDFLYNLKNSPLNYKPLIIVTTNIASNIIYDKLHKDFVDLIFYKRQPDYSPKLVIDSITLLLQVPNFKVKTCTSLSDVNDTELRNRINKELDLIGISYKLKGREYIFEGILLFINYQQS